MIKAALAVALTFAGTATAAETYRLVHAIGTGEKTVEKNMSQRDCQARKAEYIGVAEALGIHNEATGRGSITCLPDSLFDD